MCVKHISTFGLKCPVVTITDTQTGVKSSSDKLIISSLEERWVTKRNPVSLDAEGRDYSWSNRYQEAPSEHRNLDFFSQLKLYTIFFPSFLYFSYVQRPFIKINVSERSRAGAWHSQIKVARKFQCIWTSLIPRVHWHKIKAFMFCISRVWLELAATLRTSLRWAKFLKNLKNLNMQHLLVFCRENGESFDTLGCDGTITSGYMAFSGWFCDEIGWNTKNHCIRVLFFFSFLTLGRTFKVLHFCGKFLDCLSYICVSWVRPLLPEGQKQRDLLSLGE